MFLIPATVNRQSLEPQTTHRRHNAVTDAATISGNSSSPACLSPVSPRPFQAFRGSSMVRLISRKIYAGFLKIWGLYAEIIAI